ncbi:hypothetical protein SDC9_196766 [bioreactor metagenome]|uniref:Uncharacterized protein n=1 Tax=bioreactor metagenome TaxID=1076179 RepID=A0A645IE88_9ZZZZ
MDWLLPCCRPSCLDIAAAVLLPCDWGCMGVSETPDVGPWFCAGADCLGCRRGWRPSRGHCQLAGWPHHSSHWRKNRAAAVCRTEYAGNAGIGCGGDNRAGQGGIDGSCDGAGVGHGSQCGFAVWFDDESRAAALGGA